MLDKQSPPPQGYILIRSVGHGMTPTPGELGGVWYKPQFTFAPLNMQAVYADMRDQIANDNANRVAEQRRRGLVPVLAKELATEHAKYLRASEVLAVNDQRVEALNTELEHTQNAAMMFADEAKRLSKENLKLHDQIVMMKAELESLYKVIDAVSEPVEIEIGGVVMSVRVGADGVPLRKDVTELKGKVPGLTRGDIEAEVERVLSKR